MKARHKGKFGESLGPVPGHEDYIIMRYDDGVTAHVLRNEVTLITMHVESATKAPKKKRKKKKSS